MPDREKVINSIRACAHHPDHDCQSCDYCDNLFCYNDQLIEDFVTLMKEQEAEIRQLKLALDIAKGACKGIKV